jgi:maltose/moltooligosaccharide transporter
MLSSTPEIGRQAAPATEISNAPRLWRVGTLVYTTTGLIILFCWLLGGDFAWQMKERAVAPVAQLMLKQFKASDFIVGLLVGSLPAALGLIMGPIISVQSDRHRGRWGRRIPYLFIPTPFIVLGMMGLAYTPEVGVWLDGLLGVHSPGAVSCRLIAFAMSWTAFEIFTTIANTVFGGLINDVVPTPVIGRFFGLFRAVSLLAGVLFNFWLIGYAEEYFQIIFVSLGVLYGIGMTLMCMRVKEGEYPPIDPVKEGVRLSPIRLIKMYINECYANPYYLWLFLALMLGVMSGGPVNTFSVFYAKSIGLSVPAYGKLLVITYAISFTLSFFLGWLADKFHPIRLGIAAIGLYAVIMLWGGFMATDVKSFTFFFIAHGVLQGTFVTGTASMGQRLFPAAKFGQFGSAAGLMGALGYVILPPALGVFLDNTGHVYRYTFTLSGVLGLLGLAAYVVVYRRYQKLGGDKSYVAPI